jgi:hypothetical protein
MLPTQSLGQRIVVDLPAQFSKSDGQMPTVYPPQFCGLEFTKKFEPFALLANSPSIGVNRLINSASVVKTAITALVGRMFKYRQRSGARRSGRSMPAAAVAAMPRPECDQLGWATFKFSAEDREP